MMRALLLTFTLVVLPGVLRCLPPPPPPARLVVSCRHSFGTAGSSSSSSSSSSGPDEVHLGYKEPVRTLHGQPDFLVMLPLGTGASSCVSIFDWRLKQFLCMDLSGEVYCSSKQNSEDCLFQHVWSDSKSRHHVLRSSSSGLLLTLQTPEAHRSLGHEETPEGPRGQEGHHLQTPEGPHGPRGQEGHHLQTPEGPHGPRGQEGHHLQTPEGYRPLTQGGSHRGGTRGQSSPHGGTRPHDQALLSSLLARLVLLRRQPAVRRRRRSDLISPVNPSDPLRSEPHHPQAQDHHHHHHHLLLTPQEGAGAGGGGAGLHPGPPPPPPEQEQPGAVSKETITSFDDPLRVLQQPDPPVSPVKNNLNMADEPRS